VEVLDGYIARKDPVRQYSKQFPLPTYVVEFLLGRYCASIDDKENAEGLDIVEKQVAGRTVRPGDQELFKARARENGSIELLPNAVSLVELAVDKQATRTLMPIAARRQLNDLPDEFWTKVSIEFYRDSADAVFKALDDK
jgi:predicted ATP-dependent Lon-type protease